MRRTIVITGASDGIGRAAARRLVRLGHEVIVVGRSPAKTQAIAGELDVPCYVCDFASLDQVRDLAGQLGAHHPKIDVLVNNAGAILGRRELTVDGNERTLQVNHLAPFLLTNLLLPQLEEHRATVINVSSIANHLFGRLYLGDLQNELAYSSEKAYGDAKLCNILFTRELEARFSSRGISAVALHPGNVATNFASESNSMLRLMYRTPLRLLLMSPRRSSKRIVRLATGTPGTDWQPGAYYDGRSLGRVNPQADDLDLARELWEQSAELVGLDPR